MPTVTATQRGRRLLGAGGLLALAVLGGCASHHLEKQRGGPVLLVNVLGETLPVVACTGADRNCVIPVLVAPGIPPAGSNGRECGVWVQSLAVFSKAAVRVDWKIDATNAQGIYSFSTDPAAPGVRLYADTGQRLFNPQPSALGYGFAVNGKATSTAYTYAVNLVWQKDEKSPREPCRPLDPIIVSVE